MTVVKVRGYALPEGEVVELYADGDRWTTDSVKNAELVGEGWLIPGLVDAHTHPGAVAPPASMDEALLREDLIRHRDAGVTLLRAPGLVGDPPPSIESDIDLPRLIHAGPWIAQHGQFLDGWGRRAELTEFPGVAADQARKTGWVKLIADWSPSDLPIPLDTLRATVAAVHAVGGRVAVHSQNMRGGANAVAARVDSIEHGMWLSTDLLQTMAAQGTALTPTIAVFLEHLPDVLDTALPARASWYSGGLAAHPTLIAAAAEAGVTLLAGTDSRPTGKVTEEIEAIARCGVSSETALGAGSWNARTFLGLAGLTEGGPADVVVFRNNPLEDLRELRSPSTVILRGRVVARG